MEPLPYDHVRLWRGEGHKKNLPPVSDWIAQSEAYQNTVKATGRWFTNNEEEALWYIEHEHNGAGVLKYIDLDRNVSLVYRLDQYNEKDKTKAESPRAYSLRPESEYFLPKEVANHAKVARKIEPTLSPQMQHHTALEIAHACQLNFDTLATLERDLNQSNQFTIMIPDQESGGKTEPTTPFKPDNHLHMRMAELVAKQLEGVPLYTLERSWRQDNHSTWQHRTIMLTNSNDVHKQVERLKEAYITKGPQRSSTLLRINRLSNENREWKVRAVDIGKCGYLTCQKTGAIGIVETNDTSKLEENRDANYTYNEEDGSHGHQLWTGEVTLLSERKRLDPNRCLVLSINTSDGGLELALDVRASKGKSTHFTEMSRGHGDTNEPKPYEANFDFQETRSVTAIMELHEDRRSPGKGQFTAVVDRHIAHEIMYYGYADVIDITGDDKAVLSLADPQFNMLIQALYKDLEQKIERTAQPSNILANAETERHAHVPASKEPENAPSKQHEPAL